MIATAIEVTATRAVILLQPCWLARWFGARSVTVELERNPAPSIEPWIASASRRELRHISHSELIRDALDFRVREPPQATARDRRSGSWLAPGSGQ